MIAVAARVPEWLAAREAEYAARLARFRMRALTIKPDSPAKTAAAVRTKAAGAPLVLLDAGGQTMDSEGFAAWLGARLEDAPPAFVIGGPDGHPPQLIKHAAATVSLSPLTFAHATARLILAEQLFRADCLMRGHPYPR